MIDANARILLIYTGGTIGMIENSITGSLEPFDFENITSHLSELKRFKFRVDHIVFDPVIDSSEIAPKHWIELVQIIESKYSTYDGFVVLHGTDTMSYTASALSFMLENLTKPVILTGSQLPIGKLRTDAKENLITALEIAADKHESGLSIVPEVCIFFQNDLMRGNRSTKVNVDNFSAFKSYNYPLLAKSGIHIRYDEMVIQKPDFDREVTFNYQLSNDIAVLRLYPGISPETVDAILNIKKLKAVIMETYGSGNACPSFWFLEKLKNAIDAGLLVLNITQCEIGSVDMQHYKTGQELYDIGVISGNDLTFEAAVTKLMHLLGQAYTIETLKKELENSISGELTRN